jgi:hypothetical protein
MGALSGSMMDLLVVVADVVLNSFIKFKTIIGGIEIYVIML